jgi:pilus assembly protein CpaB
VNSDAGGFVLPGDHVDLLQARQGDTTPNGARPYVAHTVLSNVRVLAIDQTSQAPKGASQAVIGAVATLEVTPGEAEAIALAKAQGEITLTLRPYVDAGGPSGGGVTTGAVRIVRGGNAQEVTVTP